MNLRSQILSDILKIFITSIKNFRNNKLLFLSITFITILSSSLLKPLSKDIDTNYNISSSTYDIPTAFTDLLQSTLIKMQESITSLLHGEELLTVVVLSTVSWFSTIVAIYVSAMSHLNKDLTLKNLVLGTQKVWNNYITTSTYGSLLSFIGSIFLFVMTLVGLFMMTSVAFVMPRYLSSALMFVFSIGMLIVPSLLRLYLHVLVTLSLATSVLEEGVYGFQALGKAKRLFRGRKVQVIVICLVFMGISQVFAFALEMGLQKGGMAIEATKAKMIFSSLLNMFSLMVYTVFYFECKESHGKEVELKLT
ncbi:hypothetical protein Sjap_010722 [Stephania japonica]|uniref:Transmembrane protein n=1 Tax=Stephania japonica TaxID=461633 RepID=A0AAP0JAZ6_9MAGN